MRPARIRPTSHSRWLEALRHQRDYQEDKADTVDAEENRALIELSARNGTSEVVDLLEQSGIVLADDQVVVEVGSGAHGLIWKWPAGRTIAVDPLARFYVERFGYLQRDAAAPVAARGEELPFRDAVADIVLSDNVIDHVQDPGRFLRESARILKPRGTFYLTVDVHHPVYSWGASAYNALSDRGLAPNVRAFPNHPFHFAPAQVEELVAAAGLEAAHIMMLDEPPPASLRAGLRQPGELVKRIFFKNRRMVVVATKPSG